MSGLEGPALAAAGGRLLGSLAAPAARALAGKVTFRWRVTREAKKRVAFPCDWKEYRQWLRGLNEADLLQPVEVAHAHLANDLDQRLGEKSAAWAHSPDRLSRALLVVEATYPAIAAALGDADRVALTEGWAQQRHMVTRDLLFQLAGAQAALDASDLAAVLLQRSKARRLVRLQPFELDEEVLSAYFNDLSLPEVSRGGVTVLVGDFGAGKSEMAESWHRSTIRVLSQDERAPFPVWLSAREMPNAAIEENIEALLGGRWRQGRGAAIVIDGLDETDPSTAQALLNGARILSATYTDVSLLLTARPGIVTPLPGEALTARLLTDERAIGLIELAGGQARDTWRWSSDMRATVTRPFFALAAAAMLGQGEVPAGEADLIRGLVEGALASATERSAVTSAQTRSVLKELAVGLTRAGVDPLSFSDQQIARTSRLVAEGPGTSTLFALPILQHWFAAQALLEEEVPATEVVVDAQAFNKWRWAAAVAALGAPSEHLLDKLVATWIAGNAGAAAWILRAAFSGHRHWRSDDERALDAKTSGPRLLAAFRVWSDALGPLAVGVLPSVMVGRPVSLGVTVSGPLISVAYAKTRPEVDTVQEVPGGLNFHGDPGADWQLWQIGGAPSGTAWPWLLVQKHIAQRTLKKLSNDHHLGAADGVWAQERRFDLCRRLLGQGKLVFGNLLAAEVRAQAVDMFDVLGRDRSASATIDSSAPYSGAEIEDLIAWIDDSQLTHVASHLPERDVEHPPGGWVSDVFSPRQLMRFEVAVHERACQAYDEALSHSLVRLDWAMPSAALRRFGIILELDVDDSGRGRRDMPGISKMRVPMDLMSEFAPPDSEAIWSPSKRAVISRRKNAVVDDWDRHKTAMERIRGWLADRDREPIGGVSISSGIADDMVNVRPASSVAAGWLHDDLKALGLSDGTYPTLR